MKLTDKEKEICEAHTGKCEGCPLNLDRYLETPACYLTIDDSQRDWLEKTYGVSPPRHGNGNKVAYLAGAISNRLDTYQQEFCDAETYVSWLGYKVLSPAWLPVGLHDYTDYMKISREMLLASDIVFFLEGWEDSQGARQEYDWAKRYGKQIAYYSKNGVRI